MDCTGQHYLFIQWGCMFYHYTHHCFISITLYYTIPDKISMHAGRHYHVTHLRINWFVQGFPSVRLVSHCLHWTTAECPAFCAPEVALTAKGFVQFRIFPRSSKSISAALPVLAHLVLSQSRCDQLAVCIASQRTGPVILESTVFGK